MLFNSVSAQNLLFCVGAVFGLYGLVSGVRTSGSSDFGGIRIRRSENPVSYWISIVINGAVGVGCLSMLIYRLLR